MPREGLTADRVVEAGAALLDEVGPDDFSLAVLAERLGVRAPSLYKHTASLPALKRAIGARGKADLAAAIADAAVGLAGDDAVRAAAAAYRRWGLSHPGRYAGTQIPPVMGDPADEASSVQLMSTIRKVLAVYPMRDDDLVHAIRFVRAAFHGFLTLETAGAFTYATAAEDSYNRLVDSVVLALNHWEAGS